MSGKCFDAIRTHKSSPAVATARSNFAPAKINLTLRVVGRRDDGYHELDSLVVFAAVGDTLRFTPGRMLRLSVGGPTALDAGPDSGNLIIKAADALAERVPGLKLGHFELEKRLPVAAGLGGGSSDAAAALRLLAPANGLALGDPRVMEAARATGADVPVCLDPRPRVMRGIGDILSAPLDLPPLPGLLVNPAVAVPTKDVFAAHSLTFRREGDPTRSSKGGGSDGVSFEARREGGSSLGMTDLIADLLTEPNDLEPAAVSLQPVIAEVLALLRALDGCRLARMSGSGATCFALFDDEAGATAAASHLRNLHPRWWIAPTVLNPPH
jgi:4-diphosphocytidyl-2-C-methyl-D-erythritol kinase